MTAHRFQESRERELSPDCSETSANTYSFETANLTHWADYCKSCLVFMRQRSEAMRPFYDKNRWNELNNIISSLHGMKDSTELVCGLKKLFQASGNSVEDLKSYHKDVTELDNWPFSGLAVFLEEIADDAERESFFESVLPFVLCLASRTEELAPEECTPVGTQQSGKSITLDRKLIATLLATGFLCAFPPVADNTVTRSINFANFYAYFHRNEYRATQAAKLRCFIHYFERLEKDWSKIDGQITLIRQVITTVPTLDDWLACPIPLCPIVVDHQNALENSGSYMLQVDFANRFIGGGVLGGGHVQEEIRFCVNPELLVSLLCMEAMEDNEAIIIKGTERFSSYRGYGKTFEFDGDFQDESERDADGNLQTTIAAIDAKSFRNAGLKTQYEENLVLRELNKALAGFYNADVGCKFLEKDESSCDCADQIPREDNIVRGFSHQSETKSAFDVLLDSAVSEAFTAAKKHTLHNTDGEILIRAMRKSVIEVFQETPQKASAYLEAFFSPSTPKCMRLDVSGQSSPLVPSTPPSSPFVEAVGFQIPSVPHTPPSTLLNGCELKPPSSTNSFADSLYASLMACVKKTSSIAGSIAVTASSPVKTAVVTKETFAKRPKYIGSSVKGGDGLISFLSYTLCGEDFVQDLATLIDSAKSKGSGDSGTQDVSQNVRQNLTLKFESGKSSEECSACPRVKLEEFASELARFLLDSGINAFVKSSVCTQHSREVCASVKTEERDSAMGFEDDLVARVLSTAFAEVGGLIAEDPPVEFDLTGDAESWPVSSNSDSELEGLSEDLSYEQVSSPEEKSSDQEIVLENVDDVREGFKKMADKFSESVLHSGIAKAVDYITEQRRNPREGLQESGRVEELAGENSSAKDALYKFAEDLSEVALSAGVQLAGARLRLRQSEAVLRPVATGNWGCGVFRGDPELKALVQWLAASAAGSPALVYHTFGNKRLSQLFKVLNILRLRDHKVCDVTRELLRFCDRVLNESGGSCRPKLSSVLLETVHTT